MLVKLKKNKMLTEILGINELEVMDRKVIGKNVYFYVETKAQVAICPVCGAYVEDIKEYKQYTVRDLPAHGKKAYLVITKKRFCCEDCEITFTEPLESIAPGEIYTKRYMELVYNKCKRCTIEDISKEEELGYKAVQRIFYIYGKKEISKVEDDGHEILCIDETSLKKRYREFVLIIYSPVNNRIVDILEDRSKERLKQWLLAYKHRDKIKIVSIDMWEPYKDAILEAVPGVVVNADRFHVMKNLNECLTKARRETQKALPKEKKDELKGSRWVIVKNEEDLKPEEQAKLKKIYELCPELGQCHQLKEEFRKVFSTEFREEAEKALRKWVEKVETSGVKAFAKFLTTLKNWWECILNYFDNRITNGFIEGVNTKLRTINRMAYGYGSFFMYRLRMLLSF